VRKRKIAFARGVAGRFGARRGPAQYPQKFMEIGREAGLFLKKAF
jgi:hypothetical protein